MQMNIKENPALMANMLCPFPGWSQSEINATFLQLRAVARPEMLKTRKDRDIKIQIAPFLTFLRSFHSCRILEICSHTYIYKIIRRKIFCLFNLHIYFFPLFFFIHFLTEKVNHKLKKSVIVKAENSRKFKKR